MRWQLRLSYREIGLSVGAAASGVWLAVKRAEAVGLDWGAVEKVDDDELDALARLYAKEPRREARGRCPIARGSTPSAAASG